MIEPMENINVPPCDICHGDPETTCTCTEETLETVSTLRARIADLKAAGDAMAKCYEYPDPDTDNEGYLCIGCELYFRRMSGGAYGSHAPDCPVTLWQKVRSPQPPSESQVGGFVPEGSPMNNWEG